MALLPKIYYYVPPCPECGSKATGRFLSVRERDQTWALREALKNGELAQIAPSNAALNLFCIDCGHEWAGEVKMTFKMPASIAQERVDRHTDEILRSLDEENRKNKPKRFGIF